MSPFYCVVEETNGNKWENPEETELELQLRSYLDSNKSGPAVNDTELDLERLGDQDEEYSKTATMPIEHCNEKEDAQHWNEEKSPNNDVEKIPIRIQCDHHHPYPYHPYPLKKNNDDKDDDANKDKDKDNSNDKEEEEEEDNDNNQDKEEEKNKVKDKDKEEGEEDKDGDEDEDEDKINEKKMKKT